MAAENGRQIRKHYYHAEASAVHGDLKLPYRAKIERQAHAQVKPEGGYESQQGKPFRIEGIVSYCAAHTQVAGHLEDQEKKPGHGYKTLSTSLVESLNIVNVVTADRVVAQISTEYPLYEDEGHVPLVTFLGSQFQNLRLSGYPVEVELDLDLLDPDQNSCKIAIPKNEGFLDRLKSRLASFEKEIQNVGNRIAPDPKIVEDFRKRYGCTVDQNGTHVTELSLVKSITTKAPWQPVGNLFDIPQFGQVRLGVVRIYHSNYEADMPKTTLFEVSMIEATMGCIASGTVAFASGKTNGSSTPPTG
jgi:hypothetical protein